MTEEYTITPLIDEIYKILRSAEERSYHYGNHNPKFQIYISRQQYNKLKLEALNSHVFTHEMSDNFLFGHKIIVVDETPYVRLVE